MTPLRDLNQDLRDSIKEIRLDMSGFCLNKCEDICCDFSQRINLNGMRLSKKELETILKPRSQKKKRKGERLKSRIRKEIEEMRTEEFLRKDNWDSYRPWRLQTCLCPSYDLETKMCLIYDQKRPEGCPEFPIWEDMNKGTIPNKFEITLDARCSYIRQNWQNIVAPWEKKDSEIYKKTIVGIQLLWHGGCNLDKKSKPEIQKWLKESIKAANYADFEMI